MIHMKMKLMVVCFFIVFLTSSVIVASANAQEDESLESQVTEILADEASKGKIKVGVLDFAVTDTRGTKLSKEELQNLGAEANEKLVADVFKGLKDKGLKGKISFIGGERLRGLIEEKKLQASGLSEKQIANIGGLAGADIIIVGTIRISEDTASHSAKVLNINDGEILGIARQEEDLSGGLLGAFFTGVAEGISKGMEEKRTPPAQPQKLLDETFTVTAGNYKLYSWTFPVSSTLSIGLSANSNVDVYVTDEINYLRYKAGEAFYTVAIKKNILSSSFDARIPQAGVYYILIGNTAILTPANVALRVFNKP